jgi:hypothetical protein
MNQKYEDLLYQAGLTASGCWDELGTYEQEAIERFALLIVRECALVAKTLPHTPERHWVQDSVTYIPVHCEQNILKHFGVEE